jgi:hypothetical protein
MDMQEIGHARVAEVALDDPHHNGSSRSPSSPAPRSGADGHLLCPVRAEIQTSFQASKIRVAALLPV